MKKVFFICIALLSFAAAFAQTMPDVNKLMKMSPAELEAYKKQMIKQSSQQAVDLAEKHNLPVNAALLPGVDLKPPVKDIKRLSLIPSRPPTRVEITASLQQSIQQIQKGIPAPKIEEIKNITSNIPVEAINDKAIAEFYHDNPKAGLLMLLQTTVKDPDEINMMNNLAAMFNLCGVEQKAIPILMYALEKVPNSSILLNNIGQAYMGLGEMQRAMNFFNQCLAIDEINPEANHSMGMLHYYKKEYDAAMSYFEKELSVAMRRSTLAMAYKMGKKFNLRALAANRNKHKSVPQKNFFEEITLGKFSLPDFPGTAKDIITQKPEFDAYTASVQAEMFFWMNNAAKVSAAYNANADNYPGLYADLVQAMLDELNEEFTPEYLNPYREKEAEKAGSILYENGVAIGKVKCPEPPAGSSIHVQQEFAIACCEDKKRPIANKMVSELGAYVKPLFDLGLQRWKSYINQLVAIVQLDPNPSNQSVVYGAVAGYFAYLNTAMIFYTSGEVNNLLPDCVPDYKPVNLDSLVQSDREWRMNCPASFNIEADLGGATIKIDCNKYAVEVGAGIMAGYEHDFKSGKSTLLLGVGIKDKLGGILKVEAKSQFYLTYDNNKEFSDFGIRNTGKLGIVTPTLPFGGIKIGTNAAGIEVVNTKSLISGTEEYKIGKKGIIAELFE
jgi:tetratricopeptide (TPR) repeat protein